MAFLKGTVLVFLTSTLALGLPISDLAAQQTIDTSSHCGPWDVVTAGPYVLLADLWGASGATSGSQCSNLIGLDGDTISWKTTWNWAGGNGVKSFSNVQLAQGINKQPKNIASMPSTWNWSQSTSESIVADVAYDLFTSYTAGGSNLNEIMIWLANFNAGPISAVYNANGTPRPIASTINIAGYTWNLYSGSNGANNVFSFLPPSGRVTSFKREVMQFVNGVSTSPYLVTAQAGTEPTRGSATLTTSDIYMQLHAATANSEALLRTAYSLVIN